MLKSGRHRARAAGHRLRASASSPARRTTAEKIAIGQPAAYGKHQPYTVCGYGPQQYQAAYGESATCCATASTAAASTVAITDAFAAPTILADAQKYNQVHRPAGVPARPVPADHPRPERLQTVDECGGNGWYGEETLDVEAVHAMAPGAKVVYVGASDCLAGLDNAWAETIDNHVADIITNSWGNGTDDIGLLGADVVEVLPAVLARGGADRHHRELLQR